MEFGWALHPSKDLVVKETGMEPFKSKIKLFPSNRSKWSFDFRWKTALMAQKIAEIQNNSKLGGLFSVVKKLFPVKKRDSNFFYQIFASFWSVSFLAAHCCISCLNALIFLVIMIKIIITCESKYILGTLVIWKQVSCCLSNVLSSGRVLFSVLSFLIREVGVRLPAELPVALLCNCRSSVERVN